MKLFLYPPKEQWKDLVKRPAFSKAELTEQVDAILKEVREGGDLAIKKFTSRFDGVELTNFTVTEVEKTKAAAAVSPALKAAIRMAAANIRKFHKPQLKQEDKIETVPGVWCWRRNIAIEKVGLYIPGGTAPLFSTVLMLGIPASIAGCIEIVLCTPPDPQGRIHPAILFAAGEVGITQLYKVGGVQAIAAMTYGTESIPRVSKIFGPGNQYVTAAKQAINRDGMAIDMPAGPSEVAVFADATANPVFVASDLLSQAEHGTDSQVMLVTTDTKLAEKVQAAIKVQMESLPRKEVAALALDNSTVIVVKDATIAMELLNTYAPEHLILACEDAEALSEKVINAGSVFIGHYSPESAGDYASGTNHTLPTNGYAKAYSGVSVLSFMKQVTFQQLSPKGLQHIGPAIEEMAMAEGLEAHRRAVSLRLKSLE